MSQGEIEIPKRALKRERKAKEDAESFVEQRIFELYTENLSLNKTFKSQSEFQQILIENLVDALFVVDFKGNIIQSNKEARKLIGLNSDEVFPQSIKEFKSKNYKEITSLFKNVNFKNAFTVGLAQAIAMLPGISRSGATISTAVLLGIDKTKAARFSFLMVIPLIFGKIFKDLLSGELTYDSTQLTTLSIGFISAFLSGLVACTWMIKLVKNSKLKYFALYCGLIGVLAVCATFFNT